MTKLIINADDFGYSKGVNLGIIEAYQNGVVTSATMMTNMPRAAHAAALALENPGLGVGIHLVLDCGAPVCDHVPSLVNEKGVFHKMAGIEQFAELADIENEYASQIERFFALGLKPTHIDSHHHLHGHQKIYPTVERLAEKYRIPIRKVSANPQHMSNVKLQTAQYFNHDFYGDELTLEYFIGLLDTVLPYETAEIMTHPAYIDEPLLTGSSYALQRVRELAILTDKRVQEAIADKKIELVTYTEVANQFFV
ncbi:chitin disaccharide deacetylase [Bacillus sp. V59.32b]|uniref:chitin disaccharide deacetylase n=1 Tax=Bacillus sp. V59.32b TaxID=1758642 RepID=UPI000E3D2D8B|nr:chitin disaccharide deacetylase [Bacillus sp. V59.32b]RFU69913.1 chitin disaccharide deacetylase [Bacillus sp. V59.32b]